MVDKFISMWKVREIADKVNETDDKMGRKKIDTIRKYYSYDNETKLNTCTIDGCPTTIAKDNLTNLRRHLKLCHKAIYTAYQMADLKENCPKKRELQTYKVQLNKEDIIQATIDMVVNGNASFNLMNSRGFRQFSGPIMDALNITINSYNVKKNISLAASVIKTQVCDDLKNKMFSLKIDEVTQFNRSVLGINVQYILNNKIQIKTLAMVEMTDKHTAPYIKNIIMDTFKTFGLKLDQIYSITTNNGRNILKATSLNEELGDEDMDITDNDDKNLSEMDFENEPVTDNNELLDQFISGAHNSNFQVNTICCAANTIQLAVWDVLKDTKLKESINRCRELAVALRTTIHKTLLIRNGFKQAMVSNVTRWMSTYDMLQRLIELKDYCKMYEEVHKELVISNEHWAFAYEFCEVFRPVKKASMHLEEEQLPMGDFYKRWLQLKIEIGEMSYSLALLLKRAIASREKQLLNNNILLSSLYLDPRFNFSVKNEDRARVICHLKNVHNHSKYLLNPTENQTSQFKFEATNNLLPSVYKASPPSTHSESSNASNASENHESNHKINEYLNRLAQRNDNSTNLNDQIDRAYIDIENYKPERLAVNVNLLNYWTVKSNDFPVLSNLARIVHAAPASRVSVERCFSALRFHVSEQRNRLATDCIEDILIIKSNSNFEYAHNY